MGIKRIDSGSSFEKDIAYSRAVIDENYVHVSGTTGFDYTDMSISDDVVQQAEQCFKNIEATLLTAGSDMQKIVRVRYIFPKRQDFQPCWSIFQKYLGDIKPAATLIIAGLIDERMKLEIEVMARV